MNQLPQPDCSTLSDTALSLLGRQFPRIHSIDSILAAESSATSWNSPMTSFTSSSVTTRAGTRSARTIFYWSGRHLPSLHSLSPSSLLSLPSFPLSLLFPSPSLRSRPLKSSYRAWRCAVSSPAGSGAEPSRNGIWCILALKSDIWWQVTLSVYNTYS